MNALEKLLDTRKKELLTVEYKGEKYLVRKLSPNDYSDALIYAKSVSINQSKILDDELRNQPPDKGLVSMYAIDDKESLKIFGLDKPANLFQQHVGIRTLLAFIGYQYSNIIMDMDGNKLYKTPEEREKLAAFISEDEAFRDAVAGALVQYKESEEGE